MTKMLRGIIFTVMLISFLTGCDLFFPVTLENVSFSGIEDIQVDEAQKTVEIFTRPMDIAAVDATIILSNGSEFNESGFEDGIPKSVEIPNQVLGSEIWEITITAAFGVDFTYDGTDYKLRYGFDDSSGSSGFSDAQIGSGLPVAFVNTAASPDHITIYAYSELYTIDGSDPVDDYIELNLIVLADSTGDYSEPHTTINLNDLTVSPSLYLENDFTDDSDSLQVSLINYGISTGEILTGSFAATLNAGSSTYHTTSNGFFKVIVGYVE